MTLIGARTWFGGVEMNISNWDWESGTTLPYLFILHHWMRPLTKGGEGKNIDFRLRRGMIFGLGEGVLVLNKGWSVGGWLVRSIPGFNRTFWRVWIILTMMNPIRLYDLTYQSLSTIQCYRISSPFSPNLKILLRQVYPRSPPLISIFF